MMRDILAVMNSKLTVPKSAGKVTFFQVRSLVLSALLGIVLTGIWLVTSLNIPFTHAQSPLYFTEAPYWHIGIYAAICITMGYAIFGALAYWITRKERITSPGKRQHPAP